MELEELTLNGQGLLIDKEGKIAIATAVGRPNIVPIYLNPHQPGNYKERLKKEIEKKCLAEIPRGTPNAYVTAQDWRDSFPAPEPRTMCFPVQYYRRVFEK